MQETVGKRMKKAPNQTDVLTALSEKCLSDPESPLVTQLSFFVGLELAHAAKARRARQGEQTEHRWFESICCDLARKLFLCCLLLLFSQGSSDFCGYSMV